MVNKHISTITIPDHIKNPDKYKLEVKVSINNTNLENEVQTLRETLIRYREEHPEASDVDIYNTFEQQIYDTAERLVEDAITERFNQVPLQNLVSTRDLTPDDPIQEDRVEVIHLPGGLYEWNGSATTSVRRVHVRNGGPFEYGVIYSFPIEDVRFEDGMGRWRI